MKIGYDILFGENRFTGLFENSAVQLPGLTAELINVEDTSTGVSKRRLQITNTGEPGTLFYAQLVYHLAYPHAQLNYFTSDWGSEYTPCQADVTYPIRFGTWSGRSSKGCSPYFTLRPVGGNGPVLGISVGWSGNWEAQAKREGGENSVAVGLLKDDFFKELRTGEVFDNIEIFDCIDTAGEEAVSASFRTYYRDKISLMKKVFSTLPVAFNSWWPYEDKWINESVFYENAKEAKQLGFTNTLLDAGWFGPAGDPTQPESASWFDKQGDWDIVNTNFFPSGIAALGKRVNEEVKIPFGIWCEIEAVGKESHLYKTHPQLIAQRDGKPLNYVCMGNPETREWALGIIKTLVEEYGAKWIKIDFNLDPIACDCEDHGHGKGDGLYAHYKGLYSFMDTVREKYPQLVLENCSSGGLRIDYGIMQHCHIAFLSDPDYTQHHLKCYWGMLSHIHPSGCYHFTKSETVCAHNYTWNEKGERSLEFKPIHEATTIARFDYMTRAAMMSGFGVSHKLTELPRWAKTRLKEHIKVFHEISQDYLYNGDSYRLTPQPLPGFNPENSWSAFAFTANTGNALLFAFKKPGGELQGEFKLLGLEDSALYSIAPYEGGAETQETGYTLKNKGYRVCAEPGEWSQIYRISKL